MLLYPHSIPPHTSIRILRRISNHACCRGCENLGSNFPNNTHCCIVILLLMYVLTLSALRSSVECNSCSTSHTDFFLLLTPYYSLDIVLLLMLLLHVRLCYSHHDTLSVLMDFWYDWRRRRVWCCGGRKCERQRWERRWDVKCILKSSCDTNWKYFFLFSRITTTRSPPHRMNRIKIGFNVTKYFTPE